MRVTSEGRLARQVLSLLSTYVNKTYYRTACLHQMQRHLHSQTPRSCSCSSAQYAHNSVNYFSTSLLRPAAVTALLHEQHQPQQQQGSRLLLPAAAAPLLCQASISPWRKHSRLLQHVPSASAAFTASTPAASVHDDDGPEGELHAVETAIRANALIFAAKLAVFFVSNSR